MAESLDFGTGLDTEVIQALKSDWETVSSPRATLEWLCLSRSCFIGEERAIALIREVLENSTSIIGGI